MLDDHLAPPAVRNSTPTKIIRIGAAGTSLAGNNTSPLVLAGRNGSNPRSSSNPRSNSNSKQTRLIHKLTQDGGRFDSLRSTSRSASRRKQRRWENSHLFGFQEDLAPDVLQHLIGATDRSEFEEAFDIQGSRTKLYTRYLFPVDDKRSAFAELFLHQELLNLFRKCESDLSTPTPQHRKYQSSAEAAWMNIEKKIRTIFLSLLPSHDASQSLDLGKEIKSFQFILLMEKLLYAFVEGDLPVGQSIKISSHVGDTMNTTTPQYIYFIDELKGFLKIDQMDSSFHRLLFHGICQFYGLKSQSHALKGKANVKYLQVNKPKKALVAFEENLSFTQYLYWKILSEGGSNTATIREGILNDKNQNIIKNKTLEHISQSEVIDENPITASSLEVASNKLSVSECVLDHESQRSSPGNDLADYIVVEMKDLAVESRV